MKDSIYRNEVYYYMNILNLINKDVIKNHHGYPEFVFRHMSDDINQSLRNLKADVLLLMELNNKTEEESRKMITLLNELDKHVTNELSNDLFLWHEQDENKLPLNNIMQVRLNAYPTVNFMVANQKVLAYFAYDKTYQEIQDGAKYDQSQALYYLSNYSGYNGETLKQSIDNIKGNEILKANLTLIANILKKHTYIGPVLFKSVKYMMIYNTKLSIKMIERINELFISEEE